MENENQTWFKDVSLDETEQKNWWNPEQGSYEVEFLSEAGNEYETEFDGIKRIKIPFNIKIGDEEFILGITKAKTSNSFYGQLVKIAQKHSGLKGRTIKIIVQGSGKHRRYVLPETLEDSDKVEEIKIK